MKVIGKNCISNYIKIALQGLFVFGIGVILLLPWIVSGYSAYFNQELQGYIYYSMLAILYLSGIPALLVIYEFILLFDSLKKEKPFIPENTKHLKVASISCLIIGVEYLVGSFCCFHTIFTLVIAGTFFIAWLGLSILSELFKQAVHYKEENDLTI